MRAEDKEEVLNDPEVVKLYGRAQDTGIAVSIIDAAVDQKLSGMNPGYRIAVELVIDCIVNLIRNYERKHKPKNWLGRLFKSLWT